MGIANGPIVGTIGSGGGGGAQGAQGAQGTQGPQGAQGGTSVQGVILAVANQPPGASQLSMLGEGLASATPVPSLMDAAAPWWQNMPSIDKKGDVILVGTNGAAATFIGHDLNLIYRSADGGKTWTGIATPWDAGLGVGGLNTIVTSVAFGSGNVVVATGFDDLNNAAVMKSTDLGLTWSVITSPIDGPGAGTYPSVAYDGTVYYLGVLAAIGGVGLWTTPDLVTFTPRTTGLDSESVAAIFATDAVVLVTGFTGAATIARSTDNGATFTNPTLTLAGATLAPDGAGNWLAWVSGSPSATFSQSLDDGATWAVVSAVPTFATIIAATFLAGTGWVTTWGPTASAVEGGFIIYSAPVSDPLVWTPTGYIGPEMHTPAELVAV